MAKTIDTLEKDIQGVLKSVHTDKTTHHLTADTLSKFGLSVALKLQRQLKARDHRAREPGVIYASEVGVACGKKLNYRFNNPEIASDLSPAMGVKFLYGDILEELALLLTKEAGHTVTGEQEVVEYKLNDSWKIRGKIDAIIDGHVVDVKSVSPIGRNDFLAGTGGKKFGYLGQISTYYWGLPVLPEGAGWLVVDKQLGHINYVKETPMDEHDFVAKATAATTAIESDRDKLPRLAVVPDGEAGNMKLSTECSYCEFKKDCWKDTNGGKGLRAFAYAGGKVTFLTQVNKMPRVPEIT